jgi:hypothetical protein
VLLQYSDDGDGMDDQDVLPATQEAVDHFRGVGGEQKGVDTAQFIDGIKEFYPRFMVFLRPFSVRPA